MIRGGRKKEAKKNVYRLTNKAKGKEKRNKNLFRIKTGKTKANRKQKPVCA